MFEHIHDKINPYHCVFEINVNGQITTQNIHAPRMVIEENFISLVSQAAQSNSPVMIKMSRKENIYDEFNKKWDEKEHFVVFQNNAYIAQNN